MDELGEKIANLGFEVSPKKIPVEEIRKEILNYETCEAWKASLHVSKDDLDIALDNIATEFEDFAKRKDEKDSGLRYSVVETITKRIIQAHALISKSKTDEAELLIAEAYRLIKYCVDEKYFSADYVDGFRYVVRNLEFSVALETEADGWEAEKVEECVCHLKSFDSLSVKDQVGVLAVKQYFVGNLCRTAYDQQEAIIEKVCFQLECII